MKNKNKIFGALALAALLPSTLFGATVPVYVDSVTGDVVSPPTFSGGGDMQAVIYDPNNVQSNAFSMDNMIETATSKVLTSTERTNIGNNTTHAGLTTGNPHQVTLEQVRSLSNLLSGNIDFNGNDIENLVALGFDAGQIITWNSTEYTINIPTGLGPVLQAGQELFVIVYNGTGSQLDNGKAVRPLPGSPNDYPSVSYAIANTHEGFRGAVLLTTMDIPNGTLGIAARTGRVRDVNTNAWNKEDTLYLSDTVAGELVNVAPTFPSYVVQIGGVAKKDASTGIIQLEIFADANDTIVNFHNGTFRESFDFRVSSDGAVITGSLEPSNGHDDMTMMFSDGLSLLDTNPPATITLTAGTDPNPQVNFVYVPQSTKVLTVSTSDWPSTEHIKVAQLLLQSAATTQTNDALRNQNINDEVQDTTSNQGHLSHIGERIRQLPADHKTGTLATLTVSGSPSDVWVDVTEGKVFQMHLQTYPAQSMTTGGNALVVNDNTTAYRSTTNLNDITTYSDGSSNNNEWFNLVVWGVCNKSGETSHLMINLPSDGYLSEGNAISDASNYSNYTIPDDFKGVGFLIARFTVRRSSSTWTYNGGSAYLDLRGSIPNTTVGGGAGGSGITDFLGLTDTPSSYSGQAGLVPAVNGTETGLEFITAGAVTSVFTRTGAVVAASGDYTAAQVTNAFDKTVDDADDVDDATSTNKFTTASDISKLAGIEALADVTDSVNVAAAGATMNTDTDVSSNSYVLDEDDFASNDATKLPTQQSTKSYVDDKIVHVTRGVGDPSLDLSVGSDKIQFRMPYSMTVSEIKASVDTAPVGSDLILQVKKNGTNVFTTDLRIDENWKTSRNASIPAVIGDADFTDDDLITIDITQVGSTTAGKGLITYLVGNRISSTLGTTFYDLYGTDLAAMYSLVDLGNQRGLVDGVTNPVVEVRRDSDDADQSFTGPEVVDGTLLTWVNEGVLLYTQDTSSGTGVWGAISGTRTGNIDGIGGKNDVLRYYPNTTSTLHGSPNNSGVYETGRIYDIEFKVYIPSGNTNVDGIQVDYRGGNTGTTYHNLSTDTWHNVVINNVSPSSTGAWTVYQVSGDTQTFAGAGSSTDDLMYIAEATITETGFDGYVKTLYDQSGNDYDATQTTAANQPLIVESGVLVTDDSGNAAIKADGSDDHLIADSLALAFTGEDKPRSVFTMYDHGGVNDKRISSFGSSSSNDEYISIPRVLASNKFGYQVKDGTTTKQDTGSEPTGSFGNLLSWINPGTTLNSWSNSVQKHNSADLDVGAIDVDRFTLLGLRRTGAASNLFDGELVFYLIYDADKTSDRAGIESALSKYILTPVSK